MRLSRTLPLRRWALVVAAAMASTLLGPLAAVAQTTDDAPDADDTQPADNEAAVESTETPDVTRTTGQVCEDVLLTASPGSISGDQNAVSITSQTLLFDVEGWERVSWAAAQETTLTAVTVRTAEETVTLEGAIDTGTVEDALELTFCGETTVAPGEVCDDVLLTVSREMIRGNEAAVSITSQTLVDDVDGWEQVSWEAADGTTLTAVGVRTDGLPVKLFGDLDTGTVEDALELTFCGETTVEPGEVCDDVLLTVSPDAITGDETAVSITSQTLVFDLDGWEQVSWEAADGTTLTAVGVRTDGLPLKLIADLDTGTVEDALELTF